MSLIKCSECSKEVSDQAAACPNCGNPIKKYRSTALNVPHNQANENFEQRIEHYKKNGYKVLKRSINTVTLYGKKIQEAKHRRTMIFLYVILVLCGLVFGVLSGLGLHSEMLGAGVFWVCVFVLLILVSSNIHNVIISITTTGELEERGNVLK